MLQSCSDVQVRRQPSPEEIPFDDNTVDFITAVCVYHHIPEDRRPFFTAEVLRVLRPGAIFCIIEHNPLNPATRLIVSRTPVDADAHLLRAGTAADLISAAGAKVLETCYFLLFPQRLHKHMAALEERLSRIPLGGQYAVFASKPGVSHL
jgi:SAM-dependent methyltransferase